MSVFYKSVKVAAAFLPTLGSVTAPKTLDVADPISIKSVASTIAFGAMSYYDGNLTNTKASVGDLPDPYYWWEAGLMWGAMVDYYHYTGDPTYNDNILAALLSPLQTGDKFDYVPAAHRQEQGNDDLAMWGFTVMAAAENNFPQPREDVPSWAELATNIFDSLQSRWDTTSCGGGLLWQIYPDNPNGLTYKNTVTNGGFFNIAARLYRATGEARFLEWADKIYNWTTSVGLIDQYYFVHDGAGIGDNCAAVSPSAYTYSHGIYMYGAAVLAEATGDPKWTARTAGLVGGVYRFFSPFENATNIMYEPACETVYRCNDDMKVHKATLARFMWKTTLMQPSTTADLRKYLDASIQGAAKACTGGADGKACGQRWYIGGYDNMPGLGQQLCALELIQGLLASAAPKPLRGAEIKVVRDKPWASAPAPRRSTVVV